MSEKGFILGKTSELTRFYRALAKFQSNAIFQVLTGADEAEIRKRALQVTRDLEAFGGQIQQNEAPDGQPCPRGQRWDEDLRACVDE